MEQRKTRWIYRRWVKILTAAVAVLSVMGSVLLGVALLMVLGNGVGLADLQEERAYANTERASQDVTHYLYLVEEYLENEDVFGENGGYNPLKTVDITNWEATDENKNLNTTYTMEQLISTLKNDQFYGLSQGVDQVKNGEYEVYGYSGVQMEGYSAEFRFLYTETASYEVVLPQSGVRLADYAYENGDDVSLRDLYTKFLSTVEAVNEYVSCMEELQRESNICYFLENLDTGRIYTNVSDWENYDQAQEQAQLWKNGCIFQRSNGVFQLVENKAIKEVPSYSDYLLGTILSGKNERGVVSINTTYPVNDSLRTNGEFYNKVMPWSRMALVGFCAVVLLFLISWILAAFQAGRNDRDLEIHLNRLDYMPTEISAALFFLGGGVLLGALLGSDGFYAANSLWAVVAFLIVVSALLGIVGLAGYLTLIRRIKGRNLWSNSLCSSIVTSCRKVYEARTVSGKIILSFGGVMFLNMFLLSSMSGFGFLLALLLDLIVLLCLVKDGAGRKIIKDGLKKLADGELEYKIPLTELRGDNLEMAETINHVGEGLQNAVKRSMKSERLKADLITNVSHDIKTPLTSIINYVDLLKREDIQNEKVRNYIEILDKKSQRLKQLTEDLVEASKVSSGNVTLEMQNLNFNELVQQTNGEFAEQFAARDLELICHLPQKSLVVYADGRRIWRVIENLYRNVAKYAMPGTRVYVDVYENSRRVYFSIKNISEYPLNIEADELTERFIRGDVSRSTEGSGLGLSIAKDLTVLQKGTFDIYLDGDLFKVTVSFAQVETQRENQNFNTDRMEQ